MPIIYCTLPIHPFLSEITLHVMYVNLVMANHNTDAIALATPNMLIFVFIQQVLLDVLSLCELSLCSSDSFTHTQLEAEV